MHYIFKNGLTGGFLKTQIPKYFLNFSELDYVLRAGWEDLGALMLPLDHQLMITGL